VPSRSSSKSGRGVKAGDIQFGKIDSRLASCRTVTRETKSQGEDAGFARLLTMKCQKTLNSGIWELGDEVARW
jgi:hypothetical protein